MRAKNLICSLLSEAGIVVNGDQAHDIQVHNEKLYRLLLGNAQLGLGESYMDAWWDCEALDEMINRILRADLQNKVSKSIQVAWLMIRSKIFNRQSKALSKRVSDRHYNLGNDLFKSMLDKRLTYSCAYWKGASNLDEAQEKKLDSICRKLNLKPGMTLLDIGCGWGSLAGYAAEKYQVQVTAYNISEKQLDYARDRYKNLPIDFRLDDYRNASGQFDAVVSVGFFEHVGYKNYREYMELTGACLKDKGVSLLHTISNNATTNYFNPWSDKYIFPEGMIPSLTRISKSMEKLFVLEDLENIGPNYDPTLMAWYKNFEQAWPQLKSIYDDRFYRMWRYYLLSSAGGFRSRMNQVSQIVLTKIGRDQPLSLRK